jgi:hypothetical protein
MTPGEGAGTKGDDINAAGKVCGGHVAGTGEWRRCSPKMPVVENTVAAEGKSLFVLVESNLLFIIEWNCLH